MKRLQIEWADGHLEEVDGDMSVTTYSSTFKALGLDENKWYAFDGNGLRMILTCYPRAYVIREFLSRESL